MGTPLFLKVENVLLVELFLVLSVLAALQIHSERFLKSKLKPQSLKYVVHRLALPINLIELVRCVDPFQVHGWIPFRVDLVLRYMAICLMLLGFIYLVYISICLLYAESLTARPRSIKWICGAAGALTTLVTVAAIGAILHTGKEWPYGFLLLWIAFITAFLLVLYFRAIGFIAGALRRRVSDVIGPTSRAQHNTRVSTTASSRGKNASVDSLQSQDDDDDAANSVELPHTSSTSELAWRKSAKKHMSVIVIAQAAVTSANTGTSIARVRSLSRRTLVLSVVTSVTIVLGVLGGVRVMRNPSEQMPEATGDPYDFVTHFVQYYAHAIFGMIYVYFTWIPLRVPCLPAPPQRRTVHVSGTTPSRSHRKQRVTPSASGKGRSTFDFSVSQTNDRLPRGTDNDSVVQAPTSAAGLVSPEEEVAQAQAAQDEQV